MRQAGMKPKSHSSGTYWIRANANTSTPKSSEEVDTLDNFSFKGFIFYLLAYLFVLYLIII